MHHLQLRGGSIGTGATATVHAGYYFAGSAHKVYAVKRFKAGREKDFVREKEALMRLRHLPGVLQLQDTGVVRHRPALVLEMCGHGDLMSVMEAIPGFGLPSRVARVYARQLWSAVAAMHARGVYHMDIKPENCLIGSGDFALKLCDFGFAHTEFDDVGSTMDGTLLYMAPEVLASDHRKPYSRAKADCWSAGVTAFAIAVGEHPYSPQAGKFHPSLTIEGDGDLPSVLEAAFGITLHPGSRIVAAVTPQSRGFHLGVKPGCSVLKETLKCGHKREVTFSCRTENWYFKALRLRKYDAFWRGVGTFSTDLDGLAELGDDGKEFLLDALEVSAEDRPTASEMCGSAWLKRYGDGDGGEGSETSGDENESFLSDDSEAADGNGKVHCGRDAIFSSHDREIVADFFMNEIGVGLGLGGASGAAAAAAANANGGGTVPVSLPVGYPPSGTPSGDL